MIPKYSPVDQLHMDATASIPVRAGRACRANKVQVGQLAFRNAINYCVNFQRDRVGRDFSDGNVYIAY